MFKMLEGKTVVITGGTDRRLAGSAIVSD